MHCKRTVTGRALAGSALLVAVRWLPVRAFILSFDDSLRMTRVSAHKYSLLLVGSGASGTSSYRRFLSTNQLRQVSPLDAVVEDPVNPGNTRRVKVRPPPPPYPTQSPSEEGKRVDRLHGASPSDSKRHIQRARHDPQRRNTVIMRGREHGIGCTEAGIDWDQVSTTNGPRPRIFMVRNDSRPGRATAPAARKPNKVDKRTEVDMLTDYLVMLSK